MRLPERIHAADAFMPPLRYLGPRFGKAGQPFPADDEAGVRLFAALRGRLAGAPVLDLTGPARFFLRGRGADPFRPAAHLPTLALPEGPFFAEVDTGPLPAAVGPLGLDARHFPARWGFLVQELSEAAWAELCGQSGCVPHPQTATAVVAMSFAATDDGAGCTGPLFTHYFAVDRAGTPLSDDVMTTPSLAVPEGSVADPRGMTAWAEELLWPALFGLCALGAPGTQVVTIRARPDAIPRHEVRADPAQETLRLEGQALLAGIVPALNRCAASLLSPEVPSTEPVLVWTPDSAR